MKNPSKEEVAPKTGDLLERTFPTRQGPVDFLAEVVVEGSTLILNDIVVYSHEQVPRKGLEREAFAARTQIIAAAKA